MAGTDQNAPDDDLDPSEDTPEPDDEDGAEDVVQPEPDQARLKEAQATITRQAQELALFRKGQAPASESDVETGGSDPYTARLEAESWTLAEQVYGAGAIEAYRAAYRISEQAVTPTDHLAAFEAYHAMRSGDAPAPAAVSGKPSRAEATTPRVDANRSDLGPDLQDAETKLSEARKGTSLADFAAAATARMGYGRSK